METTYIDNGHDRARRIARGITILTIFVLGFWGMVAWVAGRLMGWW